MLKKFLIYLCFLAAAAPCFAAKKPAMTMPPAFVSAAEAKQIMWQDKIEAAGTLAAFHGITVRAEVPGRVTQIFFHSGTSVSKGALLLQINPDVLKAQLMQAQALYALSKVDYDRAAKLYKEHAVSQADYDKSYENMRGALAHVNSTQAQLDQTLIKAPFGGKLGLKQVDVGDVIQAGQAIVNLQDLNPLRVDFSIPGVYLDRIHVNDKVLLNCDAYHGITFTGQVYALESLIDRNTRSLDVRATIPNPDKKLLPGMFVQVTLYAGESHSVIVVPQTAIVYSAEGNYVYKVVDGHAVKTLVELGQSDADNVIVKTGLTSGEEIVIAGGLKLYDGAAVVIAH